MIGMLLHCWEGKTRTMTLRERWVDDLLDSAVYRATVTPWGSYTIHLRDSNGMRFTVEVRMVRGTAFWTLDNLHFSQDSLREYLLNHDLEEEL